MRSVKCFFVFFICISILMSGCSGTNYQGEGAMTGATLGGIAGYFGSGGNPAITAASAAGGALFGGAIGMMIDKKEGAYEQDLSIRAKELKLYEECMRIAEYNQDELALNRADVYGGTPADYAPPRRLVRCQRMFPEMFADDEEIYEEEEE